MTSDSSPPTVAQRPTAYHQLPHSFRQLPLPPATKALSLRRPSAVTIPSELKIKPSRKRKRFAPVKCAGPSNYCPHSKNFYLNIECLNAFSAFPRTIPPILRSLPHPRSPSDSYSLLIPIESIFPISEQCSFLMEEIIPLSLPNCSERLTTAAATRRVTPPGLKVEF